jgi:hypothetical protein
VAEPNNNDVFGFIASTVETILNRLNVVEERMATKDDLARLDGRLNERLASLDSRLSERIEVATISIRGDIEQIHLRLDSMEHRISSRDEHFDAENLPPAQRCLCPRQRSSRCSAPSRPTNFLSTKTDDS